LEAAGAPKPTGALGHGAIDGYFLEWFQ